MPIPTVNRPLAGWGRYPTTTCRLARPEKLCELAELVATEPALLARGLGRSYGDAALNPAGVTVQCERLDRLLSFDPSSGRLRAEAGVSLETLLRVFVPRGWFLPVTPGTKFVTLGGAVAADVHGKNHHRDGTFGAHVQRLQLLTADGALRECLPGEELFRATLGGMGLTGVIREVEVALQPIASAYIRQRRRRAADLDAAMALFAAHEAEHQYSVAWIDCLAGGRQLGRSILMFGDHAPLADLPDPYLREPLRVHREARLAIPFELPAGLLSRFSVATFNRLYYGRARDDERLVHYDPYFYPLDGIRHWNRLYGPAGFVQYQCALPPASSRVALVALLERCGQAGRGSFLAVLKRFGAASDGWLSFPMPGYTLALDLPVAPGLIEFLADLDRIVLDAGGRVYLAKDARLDAEHFRRMYPEWQRWLAVRRSLDPEDRFRSSLGDRLGLSGAQASPGAAHPLPAEVRP